MDNGNITKGPLERTKCISARLGGLTLIYVGRTQNTMKDDLSRSKPHLDEIGTHKEEQFQRILTVCESNSRTRNQESLASRSQEIFIV